MTCLAAQGCADTELDTLNNEASQDTCRPGAVYDAFGDSFAITNGKFDDDFGSTDFYFVTRVISPAQDMEYVATENARDTLGIGTFVVPPEDDLELELEVYEKDILFDDFVASSAAPANLRIGCDRIAQHTRDNPLQVALQGKELTAVAEIHFEGIVRPPKAVEVGLGGVAIPFASGRASGKFDLFQPDLPVVSAALNLRIEASEQPSPARIVVNGPRGLSWDLPIVEFNPCESCRIRNDSSYYSGPIELPLEANEYGSSSQGSWNFVVEIPGASSDSALADGFLAIN